MNTLNVSALGAVRYRDGLALMDALVAARAAEQTGDWLLYPDHEPVLTVGRNPSEGNVLADAAALASAGVEVVEVPRGGDVTWHGPGQLVGYPHRQPRSASVVTVHRLGCARSRTPPIAALPGTASRAGASQADARACGCRERRRSSIGVAVRRWVGYRDLRSTWRTGWTTSASSTRAGSTISA